jgi:DNA-binding beta-propeller fold protein YncE
VRVLPTLLVNLIAATLAVAAGPEPVLKRSIPLPGVSGRIDHFAYDPQSKRLFVAALENGSLEVIDLDKGERTRSVSGLKEPQGVVFVPTTKQVVVACGGDGTIRAFDSGSLEEKQKVTVGEDADNTRLSADGKTIVVGHSSGALALLDAATLKTTGEIKLSGHPESFQLESGGSGIFVNVPGGVVGGGGEVAVADRSTQKVTSTWKLSEAGRNFPMALDTTHKRLYVGCRRSARLLVLDTDSGKVVASPGCVGDADEVFVDDATGRVLVVGGDGAIDVFETKDHRDYEKVASVKTASGARTGLLVPDLHTLFVAVPKRSGQQAEIREYALPEAPTPVKGDKP